MGLFRTGDCYVIRGDASNVVDETGNTRKVAQIRRLGKLQGILAHNPKVAGSNPAPATT